jgi:nucleotide-binding universal stress UspA family protein
MGARVLVATDGSTSSITAARRGLAVLDPAAAVTVVSVVQHPVAVAPITGVGALPLEGLDPETFEHDRRRAEEAVETTTEALGIVAHGEVLDGDPGEAICRYAAEGGFDTIVVGSHGAGLMRRLLVGSVSHHVLHHAPCPVLVVHLDDEDG